MKKYIRTSALTQVLRRLLILSLVPGLTWFVALPSASAATFPVSNVNDSGAGSLRAAILSANTTAGTNTITFDAGVIGTITLTSGQLSISNHVNIIGPGPATLAISGNDTNRVLRLPSGRIVFISGLTIRNGFTTNSGAVGLVDAGAGIQNAGTLTLSNCVVRNNTTFRTRAGGILSSGTLTLYNCVVSSNVSTAIPGDYGSGGGIQSIGPTFLYNCAVTNNTLTSAAGMPSILGGTLFGGGIIHSDSDSIAPYDVLLLSNTIVRGNIASGGANVSAEGGGINGGSAALIIDSTISGNIALGGTGTNSLSAESGNGEGGGLYFSSSSAVIVMLRSTVSGNNALGGNGTNDADAGAGLGGGYNGGLLRATNCTFSGNFARGGISATGDGGDGYGGGIYFTGFSGSNVLANSTVTLNTNAVGTGPGGSGSGSSGGIYRDSTDIMLQNTIVAQNGGSGFGPDIRNSSPTAGSYNLIGIGDFSGVVNGVNNNQTGTTASPLDPKLGPLLNNGGLTQTHALLATSPAIDKGISTGIPTDQRGTARPVDDPAISNASGGDGSDIGAYEVSGAAVAPTLTIVPAGSQVTISWSPNTPGYTLQEKLTLATPTWTGSPSGATNPITVPAPVPVKFYRLIKP